MLADVLARFVRETEVIEAAFLSCNGAALAGLVDYPSAPLEEGCLVALWDAWGRFLRHTVLTSTAGPSTGLSGATYVPPHPCTAEQSLHALQVAGHCRGYAEPTWHSPQVLSTVIRALKVPNGQQIMNGIGVSSVSLGTRSVPNPLKELRACRNFVAHKSDETLNHLAPYGALRHGSLQEHLRSLRHGVPRFSDLTDACRAVAEAALV